MEILSFSVSLLAFNQRAFLIAQYRVAQSTILTHGKHPKRHIMIPCKTNGRGVAIVQVLAESDPTLPGRIRESAESWYRIFEDRGEDGACEVLLIFGRALADKELFPSTDS